jgi:hypothetical protein
VAVIIIDGPEKAGKTTLANVLMKSLTALGGNVKITKQSGRALPDETVYFKQLMEDVSRPIDQRLVIWDRSWASEYVYGKLLHQNRPMAKDPFKGEFVLGNLAQANGIRIMLAGPAATILNVRRDSTDLDVDPADEQELFIEYARRFGWTILHPESTWKDAEGMTAFVIGELTRCVPPKFTALPPHYYGKMDAETIIVTSKSHAKIGIGIGESMAMKVGWVYPHLCPPPALRHAKTLVVYDAKALRWVQNYVLEEGGNQELINNVGNTSHNINQIISHRKG